MVRDYRILLTLVTAVVLTISLCAKAPVKPGSVLGVLAHPAVTASCLILAWLLLHLCHQRTGGKGEEAGGRNCRKTFGFGTAFWRVQRGVSEAVELTGSVLCMNLI